MTVTLACPRCHDRNVRAESVREIATCAACMDEHEDWTYAEYDALLADYESSLVERAMAYAERDEDRAMDAYLNRGESTGDRC